MNLPKLADVDPALLTTFGACAMRALSEAGYLERRDPTPPANTRRTYASEYVGVTTRHGKWLGQWGPHGKTKVTRGRPATDREAAVARAQALGLDYLEKRDGSREAI